MSDTWKNVVIVALVMVLVSIGSVFLGVKLADKGEIEVHNKIIPIPSDSIVRDSAHLRPMLFHVVASEPMNFRNRPRLIEKLLGDDRYSDAAIQAVRSYAADCGLDLNKMSVHDVLKWVWDHKEEIVKLLAELLPLFIHGDAGAVGSVGAPAAAS